MKHCETRSAKGLRKTKKPGGSRRSNVDSVDRFLCAELACLMLPVALRHRTSLLEDVAGLFDPQSLAFSCAKQAAPNELHRCLRGADEEIVLFVMYAVRRSKKEFNSPALGQKSMCTPERTQQPALPNEFAVPNYEPQDGGCAGPEP